MTPLLTHLLALCRDRGASAYCVGGCVRDRVLGRQASDLDVALVGAVELARELAEQTRSFFVLLDDGRGTARVIPRDGGAYVDLAELQGDILNDLCRRDYTINAIACALAEWDDPEPSWIDPTGGLADLQAGVLRLAGADALRADPLRVLRGYRLRAVLGVVFEAATRLALRQSAADLMRVAAERVWQEWLLLLAAPHVVAAVADTERDGVLAAMLPETAPGASRRLTELAPWVDQAAKRLPGWEAEPDRLALLRFAVLLGAEGEPPTAVVAQRFLLSRAQRRVLGCQRAPADDWPDAPAVLAGLALDHGAETVGAVLRAAAAGEVTPVAADNALQDLAERLLPRLSEPALVDGTALQVELGLKPGPGFARVLRQARLAQLLGLVTAREQALALVRSEWESDG